MRGARATASLLCAAVLLALVDAAQAATTASGPVLVDTLWRAQDGPVEVLGDVDVVNGATLTIEAGVTVYMASNTSIVVTQGALRVAGTQQNPVVITSTRDRGTDTPAPGDWGQLRFLDGTRDADTVLEHLEVRYGKGVAMQAASPTLNSVTIAGHAGPAISIDLASSPAGSGNRALGNVLNGILVPPGDIQGSVRWRLRGIPFVIAGGTVGVGAAPTVAQLDPNTIEQGSSITAVVRGTRLAGAESVTLGGSGLAAEVLPGGSDSELPVRITAQPTAPTGTVGLEAQVAAGKVPLPAALTVILPLPPLIASDIAPTSIRLGESKSFTINGAGLFGARVDLPANSGLTLSGLQTTATQATFTLAASGSASTGSVVLTLSNPGIAKGTAGVSVTVRKALPRIVVTPAVLAVPPDPTSRSFRVGLSDSDDEAHVFTVTIGDASVVQITPLSFTIPAGQTQATLAIKGLKNGQTNLGIASPGLASVSVPVLVTPEYDSINTAYASGVGVSRDPAVGAGTRTAGPLAGALVGIVAGRYVAEVIPRALTVGTGPVTLVVRGAGLEAVSDVRLVPESGITRGTISVSPDGSTVSIPVTVAANATASLRQVVLTGTHAPYALAQPDVDRVRIVLPAPQIESIDPVLAAPGTTAVGLVVRGRYLQGASLVEAVPPGGIFIGTNPAISADGSTLTTALSVAADASSGTRLLRVTTPGGTSTPVSSASNTLTIGPPGAPLVPVTSLAAPMVGVARDAGAAPSALAQLPSALLGVTVGPVIVSRSPPAGIIGETVSLAVTGAQLQGVTALQFLPPTGLTAGAPVISTDGRTVTFPVIIDPAAPQTLRAVRVRAGSGDVPFADPSQASFRVTPLLPRIDSVTPNTVLIGGSATPVLLRGVNFQNASEVRIAPPDGITISKPPVLAAGATEATVNVTVASGAAPGPRAIIISTPAGETSSTPGSNNTVILGSTLSPLFDSLAAPLVGVGKDTSTVAPRTVDRIISAQVGIAVGAIALSVEAPTLYPLADGELRIRGEGLAEITEVRLLGAGGVSIASSFQVSADGKELTVRILVDGNPDGGYRQIELRGAGGRIVSFADPAAAALLVRPGAQYYLPASIVGVTRESSVQAPPPARLLSGAQVGVVVGPLALALEAPALYPAATGVLTITGQGLQAVTNVRFLGLAGVVRDAFTISVDGTRLSVPLTVAGNAAPGVRAVVLDSAAGPVPFVDPRAAQIAVATGVPSIDSIDPIVWRQGQGISLTIRGQHLGQARRVVPSPAEGISVAPAITVSPDGTTLTVGISVAPDAPPSDEGLVQVETPGGITPAVRTPANSFRIVP